MGGKKVILAGATGMVGGCALRVCLDDPGVSRVTVIGRRSTGVEHAKVHEVLHDDFMDFTAIADALEGHDAALYCIGVYTGTVPDDEFGKITVNYTLSFAGTLFEKSPQASFCFLSGQGADQTGRSRMAFTRYKGRPRRHCLRSVFPVRTSSGPGTSIP